MSFGETWRNAAEGDKFEPEPGNYKVKIVGGNAFTSRAGDDYCKLDLQILEGDDVGRRFEHFMGFKHEVGSRINREALLAYGLRDPEGIERIEDLDDRIGELTGTEADVTVSYKDGYIQIKVFGSKPPQPVSDVTPAPEADRPSFAAAAGKDDDVSWLS